MKKLLLGLTLILSSVGAQAQTFPDRKGLAVVDAANVLPDEQERALNNRIVAWNKSTGNEFVVATIPSLEGYDIKDYGYRLGRYWKLGKDTTASEQKGLVFLYAPSDKKARIEVGLGLEPVITDAVSNEIIRNIVIPNAKKGDHLAVVTQTTDALISAATPKVVDNPRPLMTNTPNAPMSDGALLFLVVAILIAVGSFGYLWVLFRNQKRESDESEREFKRTMEDIQKPVYTPTPKPIRVKPIDIDFGMPKGPDGIIIKNDKLYGVSKPKQPTRMSPPLPPKRQVAPPPPPPTRREDDSDSFGSGFGAGAIFGSGFGSDDSSTRNTGWGSSDDSSSSSPDTFDSGGSDSGFGGGGSDGSWE